MSKSLVPLTSQDSRARLERLMREERELAAQLAELEERVRRFEDFERPAYESWIRLELGPLIAALDELHQQIYEKRLQAQRLVTRLEGGGKPERESDLENEARRRAKLESKRDAKREKKKSQTQEKREAREALKAKEAIARGETPAPAASSGRSLVSLYRSLARRLHPDSPDLIKELPRARVLGLWMEVQNAYDSGNSERLLAILAWLGEGGAKPAALSYGERLDRVRAIKSACSKLVRKIAGLAGDPAWEFESMPGSQRRKLRHQAARELEDEMEQTQEVLEQLEGFLHAMKRGKGMGVIRGARSGEKSGTKKRGR